MPTYQEEDFEDHIEAHLNRSRYRSRQPVLYNKDLCLIPGETLRFIQETQLNEYQRLEIQYGRDTPTKLLNRVSKEIAASRGARRTAERRYRQRVSFQSDLLPSVKRYEPRPPKTLR